MKGVEQERDGVTGLEVDGRKDDLASSERVLFGFVASGPGVCPLRSLVLRDAVVQGLPVWNLEHAGGICESQALSLGRRLRRCSRQWRATRERVDLRAQTLRGHERSLPAQRSRSRPAPLLRKQEVSSGPHIEPLPIMSHRPTEAITVPLRQGSNLCVNAFVRRLC